MSDEISLNGEAKLFIVDDDGLVFIPATQELIALNTAATFIWCCLEEGQSRDEVVAAMMQSFRIDAPVAQAFLRDALALWTDWGLLTGQSPRVAVPTAAPTPAYGRDVGDTLPPHAERSARHRHRYRLLDGIATLSFCDDASRDWVDPILAHLHAEPGGVEAIRLHILRDEARGGDRAYVVYRDGLRLPGRYAADRLGPLIKSHVWQACLMATPHVLNIHAGAVHDAAGCILLPGAPGSSKSTLSAALGRRGFTFLSDEVALLTAPDLRVRPVPLSFCVKSTGWDVLAPFYPELETRPTHQRGDDKIVRYIRPPVDLTTLQSGYAVTRVIFPRYVAGCATALRPLSRVEGLRRLLSECVSVPDGLSTAMVETLVEWVRTLHFWELEQSNLEQAITAIAGTRASI